MSETALVRIKKARADGLNVYIDEENILPKTDYYRVETTNLAIKKDDCYNIQGVYEPKSEVLDNIAEANGIIFTYGEVIQKQIIDGLYTDKDGKPIPRTVYIGRAECKRVITDGAEVNSGIMEYELDPAIRALDDCAGATVYNPDTCARYKTQKGQTMAKAFLTYSKFGRQLANTRARNRAIRKLVGLPISYKETDLNNGFMFARIVPNLAAIAATPHGAILAASKALNMDISALFGAKKSELISTLQTPVASSENPVEFAVTEEADGEAGNNTTGTMPDFDDDPAQEAAKEAPDEFKAVSDELLKLIQDNAGRLNIPSKSGIVPFVFAKTELEDTNGTLESRRAVLGKIQAFLKALDDAKKARGEK
jgi:hypothetical protein